MKKLIMTSIAAVLFAVTIQPTAAVASGPVKTLKSLKRLKEIKVTQEMGASAGTTARPFNKIWVAGKVKIILTQSINEGVFVDENYNPEKTTVIGKGQTMFINSMESGQVTLYISMRDLQRIEAAGSSEVTMRNTFDLKYLQLYLSQSASVNIDANVADLLSDVKDNAKVKIRGAAAQHSLIASNRKNVRIENLICFNSSINSVVRNSVADSLLALERK